MFSFRKLCRLCASYKDSSLTLNSIDSENILLMDKLKTIAPRILECNINLPEGICINCNTQLNDAYTFVKQCFNSQDILKRYLDELQAKENIKRKNGSDREESEENTENNFLKMEIENKSEANNVNCDKKKLLKTENIKQENGSDREDSEDENNSLKREVESVFVKEEMISDSESTGSSLDNEEKGRGTYDYACFNVVETELVEENNSVLKLEDNNERRYKCNTCYKAFLKMRDLKIHYRTHTNEKPYICKVCDKSFSQKPNLRRHTRIHTNERIYKCELCEKGFTENASLQKHMRTHTKERPFRCKLCEKTFSQSSHLARHVSSHTNNRAYKCDTCGKGFNRKSILDIHMRIHTNIRPYKCHLCEKAFTQKPTLQYHVRTHAKEASNTTVTNLTVKTEPSVVSDRSAGSVVSGSFNINSPVSEHLLSDSQRSADHNFKQVDLT